jgi:hypothetical protein
VVRLTGLNDRWGIWETFDTYGFCSAVGYIKIGSSYIIQDEAHLIDSNNYDYPWISYEHSLSDFLFPQTPLVLSVTRFRVSLEKAWARENPPLPNRLLILSCISYERFDRAFADTHGPARPNVYQSYGTDGLLASGWPGRFHFADLRTRASWVQTSAC